MLCKESVSSTVICVPVDVVNDTSPCAYCWVPIGRKLYRLSLLLDLHLHRVNLRKLRLGVVDVLFFELCLVLSQLLPYEFSILNFVLADCAAPLHGLDDDLALLLVGVLALELLQLLVVILSPLAVRVRVYLHHLVESFLHGLWSQSRLLLWLAFLRCCLLLLLLLKELRESLCLSLAFRVVTHVVLHVDVKLVELRGLVG